MAWERTWLVATRMAAAVVIGLLVVLLATGIALTFRYRPTVVDAYSNIGGATGTTARGVHRLASVLFVGAALVLAVTSIGLFVVRRRPALMVLPVGAAGLAVVAGFTGYLLPWDQLALRVVSVGTDMRGYRQILRGGQVQYVLIGNSTVSPATVGRWYWLHALIVPLVIGGVVAALILATRRARAPQSPDPVSS